MDNVNVHTQPPVVPSGGNYPHYPAGWVDPARAAEAERAVHGQAVDAEAADKANAERDAAIDARIAAAVAVEADSQAEDGAEAVNTDAVNETE